MKRFHGMSRARGYGLRSMSIQAKLTALAVNLERIANPVSSLDLNIFHLILKIRSWKRAYWNIYGIMQLKIALFQWLRTVPCRIIYLDVSSS